MIAYFIEIYDGAISSAAIILKDHSGNVSMPTDLFQLLHLTVEPCNNNRARGTIRSASLIAKYCIIHRPFPVANNNKINADRPGCRVRIRLTDITSSPVK